MPTYLYECPIHHEFEEYHSMSKTLELCPKCQEEGLEPQALKQLINCATKGVVEIYGHELVAKMKDDTNKLKSELKTSEKLYSNILGESHYEKLQQKIDYNKKNRNHY